MEKGGSHTKHLVVGQENLKQGRTAALLDDQQSVSLVGSTQNVEAHDRNVQPASKTSDSGSSEKVFYEHVPSFDVTLDHMAGVTNLRSPQPWPHTLGEKNPQCESFDNTTASSHHDLTTKYGGPLGAKEPQLTGSSSLPSMSSATHPMAISSTGHQNNNNIDKTDTIQNTAQRTAQTQQTSKGLLPTQIYSFNITTTSGEKPSPSHASIGYTSQGNLQIVAHTSLGTSQAAPHSSVESAENRARNYSGTGQPAPTLTVFTTAQSLTSLQVSDEYCRNTKTGVSSDSRQVNPTDTEECSYQYLNNSLGFMKKTMANLDMVKYSEKTYENLHFKTGAGRSATLRPDPFLNNFESSDVSTTQNESFHVHGENSSSSEAHHFVSNQSDQQHAKPKKPRSRNSKKKNVVEKLPAESINDEDDDNDFIPVGMLQLSMAKRPESLDYSFQGVKSVESGIPGGSLQFNQGLQIQYQPGSVQIKSDPCVSQYEAAVHENNILLQQELQNQQRVQDQQNQQRVQNQQGFQKQHQPGSGAANKPLPGSQINPQQTDSQNEPLAQSVAAQHETEQRQQQYLLKLVQQAQQQKQLLVQQQMSSISGTSRTKTSSFHKNQGLIIHHQQQGVGLSAATQGISQDQKFNQLKQSQQLVRDDKTAHFSQEGIKESAKNISLERYPSNEQQPMFQRLQQQGTGSSVLDSAPQAPGSGVTRLTEHLLQQNKEGQDSLIRQNIISRKDQSSLRSVTPTLVHHNPPLNQQHPEIAKMLNSPVSPRQPASPRQSVSPRRTISPHPSSISPCHFVSPYPRQSNSPRQSTKQAVPHSPAVRHSASPQPKQPLSPRQPTSPWQPVSPSQPSPASPSLQQPQAKTGQTVASYLLSDHKPLQHQKYNQSHIGQPVTINLEKMRSSGDTGLGIGTHPDQSEHIGSNPGSHMSLSQQHLLEKASNITELHHLPIPSSQPAEVFSPGQIIHHRPQEQKKSRHGHPPGKSRSPGGIMNRLATPSRVSSNVPVPSAENASTIWQQMQPRGNKSHTHVQDSTAHLPSVESNPQSPKPIASRPLQLVDVQDFALQPSQGLQADNRFLDKPTYDQFSQQQYRSEELCAPAGDTPHQHSSSDKPGVEMHLRPPAPNFYQAQTLTRDTESVVNSLIIEPAQDLQPQCPTGLSEKETSLIKSLFADKSTHDSRQPTNSQAGKFEARDQVYSENQPMILSDRSRSDDRLKFLSEIASELAGVGKEETVTSQTSGLHDKSSENLTGSFTTVENVESKSLNKVNDQSIKIGSVVLDGVIEVANVQNSDRTKEESLVKESEVANKDLPRREVRQRKPKKPFEQDDTPTRRNTKAVTPSQKNSLGNNGHKKPNPLQTLSSKKVIKQQGKVNLDTEELDKKLKVADPVIQGSATQKQEKLSEDKFVSQEEESETDSMTDNRRLSRRLRVKEQEINKSDADANNRRSKRRSTRIDYKEEASDSVEENPSNRSRKISPSYSSSEDTVTEGKQRMTTRSKNRKDEPSEKTSSANQSKDSDNEEKPTSKKRKDDTPEDTAIHRTRRNDQSKDKNPATIKSNSRSGTPGPNTKTMSTARKANSVPQANRPAPRNRLKSPASRSRSPVTSRSTTPDNGGTAAGHRMTTRRLVTESDNSQVGSGSKSKRVTPSELTEELPSLAAKTKRVTSSEFVDEHPVLRKRTKKSEMKSSTDSQAHNNEVETQEDMTESSEPMSAIANSVAYFTRGPGSQKLDSKKRSHKRKKRSMRTKPPISALPPYANHQENIVEMKEDEKAKDSASYLGSVDSTSQEISNKQETKDVLPHAKVLPIQEDMAKQESKSDSVQETGTHNDGKPEAMSNHSEASAQETPVQETPELRTKQMESLDIKTKLRNRVVESSTRNASKQNGESTVKPSGLNSAGASSSLPSQKDVKSRVDLVQPLRDSGLTSVNVENVRQKMVMYKLVPVLGEDFSDLEEGLVPINGFFVSRGTYDRILLPHNFMCGSPTSKMSSASTDKKSNLSPVSSSWSHQASDNMSARKSGSDAHLKPVPCSNLASAQSSSSGLLQSSPWMDQSPQMVATPPPSTGESMTKKNWTTPQPQASPAYRRSPSWNATPPSILSSSPLSSSSSAWTLSSTSAVAPAQPSHSWSGPPHSTPQDSTWRLSPSVNNTTVESWGKDYFPNPSLTDSRRQAPELTSPIDSTVQNISGHQHYGSMEPSLYSAQHDEPLHTNNTSYGTGSQQDSDFAETRQESLIQGFLRHVSSNSANVNQELSSFNLGQQDFAYLERGLRQALSPTALLSAVEAYDGSGQEATACQDSSLQDSINLVHTVNLDMEEGNLDNSSNLGLGNLSGHSMSHANIPRSMDSLAKTSHSGMQSLMDSELGSSALNESASSVDGSSLVGSPLAKGITDGEEKKEEKKAMKERKHQYDIVINNGDRKFKCKICNKIFGKTTIYRHLRIHDSDYKISCTLCEKQYTQKHSLMLHMQKFHGEVNTSLLSPDKKDPGDVAMKELDKTSPNKPSEAKRQRRSSSTADPLAASLDENELLKQKETHRQVEELRRLKAEKKAHGKSGLHSADDSWTRDEGLSPSKESDGEFPIKDFVPGKVPITGYQANISDYPGTMSDRPGNDHSKSFSSGSLGPQTSSGQIGSQMPSGSKSQFQLNSPLPVMSTIAPFQTIDSTMKPTPPPSRGVADDVHNRDRAPDASPEKSLLSQADLKNFFCTVCNTQLVSRNGFMLHMRRHNVAKSKLCTSCDKKFHTTTELKTHMRTHTGERPFKCEICYMSFAHSGSFVCHKKGHTNRGELEPFPIIDGQIKYPSTFRKPRTEGTKKVQGVAGDQTKETKKKGTNESQVVRGNDISSDELSSAPTQDIIPGGRHTSVIRKNSLDASFEISPRNDSDVQRKLSLNSQEMNSSGDGVMGLGSQIFNPNVPTSSLVKEGGGYLQPGDITTGYSTLGHSIPSAYSTTGPDVTGGYSTSSQVDYYSGQSGYSDSSQSRNFLSSQVETTSTSHSYYNQEKYYARAASVDQFSPGNSNSQLRSVPVNLVVDKSQHYSEDMQGEYPQSVEADDSYYSSQQPYQYTMPPGGVDGDYEQEDYDGALSQYKGDPSSSEIVKKLLQHYNVPSSTYQETTPLDYSHQLQGAPDYVRTGRETAPPMYAEQDLGVSAPPSYSASVQQKQFYAGHTNTPEYDSSLIMSSDRTGHLPSPQATQERSYSQSTASIQLSEAYRYSTENNFHEGQYTRSPSQSYTQTYEVTSRDYYQQGLPKIESLARDTDSSSRDPVTKSQ